MLSAVHARGSCQHLGPTLVPLMLMMPQALLGFYVRGEKCLLYVRVEWKSSLYMVIVRGMVFTFDPKLPVNEGDQENWGC